MKKFLYYTVTLWVFLWIQIASNHALGGTPFSIQWTLLAVLHFGLSRGPLVGESFGFFVGLLLDASSLGLLGVHAILNALAGYAAGMLKRQLDASKLWTQAIFSWMVSMIYLGGYWLLMRFVESDEKPLQWMFLAVPVLNAAAAPVVFRVLDSWARAWDIAAAERDF